ncbi:MAG: chemotaxis protein CheW [Lachnospiraceae bacterium]|nr:chemotaxis protein CheW [Lachnospiraceae bacterium]
MALTQQVVFGVGDGEYGIDVSKVSAIEALTNVVTIPNAASHILGIMNLRGEVLPVYSLRRKFGLEEKPVDVETKIIVTKSRGVSIAFKVDGVKEILDCNDDMLQDFPDLARGDGSEYLEKVATVKSRLILLINEDKLIEEDEAKALTKLVEQQKSKEEK